MSAQTTLAQLATGRKRARVVLAAREDNPDPNRVAFIRGQLTGLAGEALARQGADYDDPTVFAKLDGGPDGSKSIGVVVYPDETAELGITSPESLRGAYRLNLDDAATIVAAG